MLCVHFSLHFLSQMISVKKYPEGRPVTTMKSASNIEMSSNSTDMKLETGTRASLNQVRHVSFIETLLL